MIPSKPCIYFKTYDQTFPKIDIDLFIIYQDSQVTKKYGIDSLYFEQDWYLNPVSKALIIIIEDWFQGLFPYMITQEDKIE